VARAIGRACKAPCAPTPPLRGRAACHKRLRRPTVGIRSESSVVATRPFKILRRHSSFVRDVATLISGKAVALVVTFFTTPIISRLFEPEHFGVGALFTSLISIMGTLATLSWERAVVLAKEESEVVGLCRLGVIALVGSCLLLWLFQGLMVAFGLHIPFSDKLGIWTWALPFGLLLMGLAQIADGVLTRVKDFISMAISDVTASLLTAGSRIASGAIFGSTVWGVVTGLMVGDFAELAVVFRASRRSLRSRSIQEVPRLSSLAAEYKDFPLYSAPTAFIRMLSQELPTVMFSIMFAPAVVGYYAMATRLARLPLRLAAQSLQRVLMQRLALIANEGRELAPAYTKMTLALSLVAFPPFAILWLFGERILAIFLGPKWEIAGRYAVVLAPWLYSLWVSNPATTVMTVLRKQALLLRVQILLAIARLAIFGIAYKVAASAEATLQAFVTVSAIAAFGSVVVTYVIVRRADRQKTWIVSE
jgi:O-antigen/teichoic acid export membrane protein